MAPGTGATRVPGAVPGRGRGRGDDLGVRVRLLDRRVALLAAADRDQELLGLDDLQVVVAHAVARPRLEPAVVTQAGVSQDGRVPMVRLIGAAPAQAEPQLVHLLEVPDGGAVGAVDLEAERALRADADPGRLQGADGSAGPRSAGEPDQGRDVVVVLDVAHLAVLDHGEVGGRAHRQDGPLGVHGGQQRADLGDRRHHVLHEVDHVAEEVAQRSAAGLLAPEPPGQGAVGFGRVAVEEHRAHVGDAAELAGRDQLADPLDGGDVPVVVADGGGDAGLPGRGGDLRGLMSVPAHRLLDPERLAGPGGRDADLAVQHVRRADGHDVDIGIGEHVAVVGAGPGVPEDLAGVVGPVGGGVGRVHEPGPDLQLGIDQRNGLVGAAVQLAHPAHADQADAGLGVSVVGGSHCGVPASVSVVRARPNSAADRGRQQGGIRSDGHERPALLEAPRGGGAVGHEQAAGLAVGGEWPALTMLDRPR